MGQSAEQINNILLFLVGTFVILLMAVGFVVFVLIYKKRVFAQKHAFQELETKHQREMLKIAIEIQEKERRRIAENLHDEVGALLSLVRLNASRIYNEAGCEEMRGITDKTIKVVDETIANVRRITKDLLPATLDKFGLEAALKELCQKVNEATDTLEISYDVQRENKNMNLPKALKLSIYRVLQELVNNALKHAAATKINVDIHMNEDSILLKVEDNGKGFDIEKYNERKKSDAGLGLQNIKSRISVYDGKIDFVQDQSKGTIANVTFNIKSINDEE